MTDETASGPWTTPPPTGPVSTLPPPPVRRPLDAVWAGPGGSGGLRPPTPPRRAPRPTRPAATDPAPRALLAWATVGGVALEVGIRGGAANALVALGIGCTVGALVTGGRLRRASSRRLALAALVPAAALGLRASPWLAASNLGAAAGLLALSILFDRGGSLLDAGPGDLARRLGVALPTTAWAPTVVRRAVPPVSAGGSATALRVGRALLVAVPILAVMVVLLASGDVVFAGMLHPDLHLGPIVGHLVLALVGGALVLAVVGTARADTDARRPVGTFGVVEVLTMLALAAGVLALFVVSQLIALTGAGKRLVEASGLTPADYARRGFFQLCAATALLLGFLALVERLAGPDVRERRSVRILGAAVPVLAVGLVVVSMRRMALYDHAFGLTMLRLWVVGAAAWFGVVLVLVAVRNAGVGGGRRWVLAGAGVAARPCSCWWPMSATRRRSWSATMWPGPRPASRSTWRTCARCPTMPRRR